MGALSLLLRHPGDLFPLITVKRMADKAKKLPKEPNLAFCYDMLNKVSRSFAIVIQQLPHELQDAVCIFYLVLRALDTVEDDMSIPDDIKCPECSTVMDKTSDERQTHIWYESCPSCGNLFFDAGEFTDLKYDTLMDRLRGLVRGRRPAS